MEEPKLRDCKKAGNLTFSKLNYNSLSQCLQEKSALKSTSSCSEILSTGWTSRGPERKDWTNSAIVVQIDGKVD